MLEKLKSILGEKNVITGEMIGADYCRDQYPGESFAPVAVAEASSVEEVAAVVKACFEEGMAVTVRGAGTGQAGGSVPVEGGVVLSLRNMNKILGYADGILRVQPGVLLQDVKAEAERNGMYYPPDPGELTATIGGNVATNAGGPCAVKYGKTRDYVESMVVVLSDGSVETVTGEELSAFVGCEGTLAVICEISLKLVEKAGADAILLFPFMDAESAVTAAKAIIDGGFEPAVVEYMDTDIVEFSGKITGSPVFPVVMEGERVAGTLMVTIEGSDDDDVMEKMEAVAGLAEEGEIEPLDILVGDTIPMKRDFWAAHAAFHTSMESGAKSAWEANVDLPLDAAAEMIEFAKETAAANELTAYIHAHLASGGMHIHLASEKGREDSRADAEAFFKAAYDKVAELGGDVVGEYGVGYAKNAYISEEFKAAQAALKAKYDAKGILNPGKIC